MASSPVVSHFGCVPHCAPFRPQIEDPISPQELGMGEVNKLMDMLGALKDGNHRWPRVKTGSFSSPKVESYSPTAESYGCPMVTRCPPLLL